MKNVLHHFPKFLLALVLSPGIAMAQQSLIVDSSGDVGVGTSTPGGSMHVLRSDDSALVLVQETGSSNTVQTMVELRHPGFPRFRLSDITNNDRWDFRLSATGPVSRFTITKSGTGSAEMELDENGDMTILGTLAENSSRKYKESFADVDPSEILNALVAMPISEWQYKQKQKGKVARHVGPVAEDFYAAFGLGKDNSHIAPRDLAGVALAAVKGLKSEQDRELAQKDARIAALEQAQASQQAEIESLKEMLQLLTTSSPVAAVE